MKSDVRIEHERAMILDRRTDRRVSVAHLACRPHRIQQGISTQSSSLVSFFYTQPLDEQPVLKRQLIRPLTAGADVAGCDFLVINESPEFQTWEGPVPFNL